METFTKIQTLYKRFQRFGKIELPDNRWKEFQGLIIKGLFSDPVMKYLYNLKFEGYEKIDGTNSKIAYFPSTGEIKVGGKTDNAQSMSGQFEMLEAIGESVKDKLAKLFPKESARFIPVTNAETNKVQYYYPDVMNLPEGSLPIRGSAVDNIEVGGNYMVELTEVPVYIYGEYFGPGIQSKVGNRYLEKNQFIVFDIHQQGWWLPKDMRDSYCKELGLTTVPFLGVKTLAEFEKDVTEGFVTNIDNPKDPTLQAEGVVARPIIPILDPRGRRLIVKIKSCDYVQFARVREKFTDDEYNAFLKWYKENIEPNLEIEV